MWHDHAQKELNHINAMISHLEHQGARGEMAPTSAVMQVDYWRTRIRAVLALPSMPGHIAKQGSVLLARLDSIRAAQHNGAGRDRR